jgi:hypothetical protein
MANPPVIQSSTVTPGHLAVWTTDGVLEDAGTPDNPKASGGFGVISSNGTAIAVANGTTAVAHSTISIGITPTAANITLEAFNGGAALSLNFIVNGTTYPFPSAFFLVSGGNTLPTSSAGLPSGTLWNNGGVVSIT